MAFYRAFVAAFAVLGVTTVLAAQEPANNQANKPAAEQLQTANAESNTDSTGQTGMTQDKINLNTATAKDLMKVKGMTASKAKSIVSYRTKHGDFKSLDDLKEVKGFKRLSEKTLKEIQDQLTIG